MLAWVLLAVAASAGACAVPEPEFERQASLPYATFDFQQRPYGWRYLSSIGCTDTAVLELLAYARSNAGTLSPGQRMELHFHVGQALTLNGRDAESVAHFQNALTAEVSPEWRNYVEATLAFLTRDAVSLKAVRDRYASIAPASMRLRFIDGMIACMDQPYAKAVHCVR